MSRTIEKRILNEINNNLAEYSRHGEKKHQAKLTARKIARETDTKYKSVRGAYATGSLVTYRKQASTVIRWMLKNFTDVKGIYDCKKHVKAYFDYTLDKTSPSTLRTRIYAMSAVFGGCEIQDFGIVRLPKRPSGQFTRTRVQSKSDAALRSEKYETVRNFVRACGARRGGLQNVGLNDFIEYDDGSFRVKLREKGGKTRKALILPEYHDVVKTIITDSPGYKVGKKTYLFPKTSMPAALTLHSHRAEYAMALYKYFESLQIYTTNKIYHCRKGNAGKSYDKGILMAVSKELGHSRTNVVPINYGYTPVYLGTSGAMLNTVALLNEG